LIDFLEEVNKSFTWLGEGDKPCHTLSPRYCLSNICTTAFDLTPCHLPYS